MKSGSRRSPDEVYLRLKSGMESDSRRSPDGVCLQLKSGMESGSCWEMCPKKPIVKLLTVEQPSIVIDLLINKIYLAFSS